VLVPFSPDFNVGLHLSRLRPIDNLLRQPLTFLEQKTVAAALRVFGEKHILTAYLDDPDAFTFQCSVCNKGGQDVWARFDPADWDAIITPMDNIGIFFSQAMEADDDPAATTQSSTQASVIIHFNAIDSEYPSTRPWKRPPALPQSSFRSQTQKDRTPACSPFRCRTRYVLAQSECGSALVLTISSHFLGGKGCCVLCA